MPSLLRSISGLRSGVTYPLRDRITLGRSPTADVQLTGESVSRFHALIEQQENGRHMIADLATAGGTRVNGQSVHRAMLEDGAVVEICGVQLRYEAASDDVLTSIAPKVTGYATLRPTKREVPLVRDPSASAVESLDKQVITDVSRLVVSAEPAWRGVLREVVEFRQVRGRTEDPSPRAKLLAERFAEPRSADRWAQRRSSRRFACTTPVLIGLRRGPEVVTMVGHMLDASADGARLRVDEGITVGAACWLLVATGEGERCGIAFSSRVVWIDAAQGEIGVEFVGQPVAGPDVLPPARAK